MVLRSFSKVAISVFIFGVAGFPAGSQVIEFESNGLKYQTLTRSGVTIMLAQMPSHVREYAVIQVAVSNGSRSPWTIRPEDFTFHRKDGGEIKAASAGYVVSGLISKASRNDVIRLVSTYESGLYGLSQFKSTTNGYEQRRQAALAEVSSAKLKAAAAASAIALVMTKLAPGESTDGAVFLPAEHKGTIGEGHVVVKAGGEVFDFTH